MRLALLVAAALALGPTDARADSFERDVAAALDRLRAEDRVANAYGAMAVQRIARDQWGFALFDSPTLRPWQVAMVPCAQALIPLLLDDDPLQWVDGASDKVVAPEPTTLRAEATRALGALERASIEPLIAALENPRARPYADATLQRITGARPESTTRASWQAWWTANASRPLRNEHGRWGLAAGVLAVVVAGTAGVGAWLRRAAARPKRGLPSLARERD